MEGNMQLNHYATCELEAELKRRKQKYAAGIWNWNICWDCPECGSHNNIANANPEFKGARIYNCINCNEQYIIKMQ